MLKKKIYLSIVTLFFFCFPAAAGQFSVSPITMELGPQAKSGVFKVINTGKDKINFQIYVSEWTQEDGGKDVYSETKDIIYFPKMLAVEAGEQRVIRVGLKMPPVVREKTYRIFIEEIPLMHQKKSEGSRINFAIRFAPPIFVKPAVIKTEGVMDDVSLREGEIRAVVKNKGNVHFIVKSFLFRGKSAEGNELFSKEVIGGYILNNVSRAFGASISDKECEKLSSVEIEAKTETFAIYGKLDVQKGMCPQ